MSHEVETMMSARGIKPWHFSETSKTGASVVVDHAPTAREAIKLAQLDWTVEKVAIQCVDDPTPIPHKYALRRDTDHAVFATVGRNYQPLQNSAAFEFLDNLVDQGLEYETAGALRGGSIVFITAKLPKSIMIGGEDAHELYLFVRNGHNGMDSVRIGITPIRVVCQNTLNMALSKYGLKRSWAVAHTTTLQGRLAEARDALDMTFAYVEAFEAQANALLDTEFSDDAFDHFLNKCLADFGEGPKEKAREGIKTLYHHSPTNAEYKGTKWGAYNAVGEYFEWVKPRNAEARMMSNLGGQAVKMRDRALALLGS
jgi:phage/plasmid-like protein (TIGR03299 family)